MDLSILDKQIFERFIRPTVNKKPQYVGVEFELPLVNLKPAPVDFWRCSMHGVNPHNVDGWDYGVSSIEELVAYIRSMSLFCTERDGKYLNFPPTPLVDYFNSESVTGEYWDGNGYKTYTFTPRLEDLAYLRSYKFVDLTFRGTVELRSACMQPVSEIMTVPAFDLGCKESMDELETLLHQSKLYQQGYSPSELRELFVRRGLPGFVDRDKLRHLLEQVVELAEQGLKKRGLGEEHMLAPLKERARRLSSPALELVVGLNRGHSIEEFIEAYGRLEG